MHGTHHVMNEGRRVGFSLTTGVGSLFTVYGLRITFTSERWRGRTASEGREN